MCIRDRMEAVNPPQSFEQQLCPYEEQTGNCLAKQQCPFKHALNVNAKVFVPGSKSQTKKAETAYTQVYYQPQTYAEYNEEADDYDQADYMEEFKNCSCCHGYVYSCSNDVCQDLGQCKCKTAADIESQAGFP
eukprot:TRINITY_DN5389_c0_g1_i10.p3 TRINITY_DN5389_c0_g1~~TRINITY_DN5389_c0_g1_i10.p3  ORF type:complete len:133 (-),score=43.74 TRINITY_DN5389_c0_g1_i10:93-491(-)